jgi:hypothetical protein
MGTPSDAWVQYRVEVESRLDLSKIFSDVKNAKPSGNGHMLGLCPFHDDHDPSFGFSTTTGCWECFAENIKGGPFDYLMRRSNRSFKEVLVEMGDSLGLPPPARNGDGTGQITYDYPDETSPLLFQVVRRPGKKFYQRRPDGNGGWINDLKGVRRVLYRLPELLARATETVFVCEGEKDCDTLHRAGLLATTNSGGAGKWRQSNSESLRGRDIVILPDNDAPGREHGLQVAKGVHGLAASVRIVELPDLPPKGDVSDWLDAGHTAADLQDIAERTPLWESLSEEIAGTGRPVIMISDHQLLDIFTDAWHALLAQNNPPRLFVSAGHLARLIDGEGGPGIQFLDQAAAYGVLVRAADWMQRSGDKVRDSKPPKEVAADILSNPHPDLPLLDAVVSIPVFDAKWRLLNAPGYHQDAHLWLYLDEDAALYDVPIHPTADDLATARTLLLDDLLIDFPFTADSDRAHAIAALLLPFARRMFTGPTPIHLLEAACPGSGKTLLAELISLIFLGEVAGSTTLTKDENETRKKITALLIRGRAVIVVDNFEGGLSSSQLAAAITTEKWDDRILGLSQMVSPPNRALWLMSANNPSLSLEIARRSIRIRISPVEEQPWTRTGFKHDPIIEWTTQNRPALVRAILTIIRSWIAAGAPQGTQTLGSFEGWSRTIGGMIAHLGLPGFLGDADEFYAAADAESGDWRAFVTAWWDRHRESPVGVRELLELADTNDLVAFACTGASDQARRVKFGKALNSLRGRKFGDIEVAITQDGHAKKRQYRLRRAGQELFPVDGKQE